ncbi:MAG: sigma-54-dependent transcriptional regulator, partial [Enterobacteriaceae bacterium]
MKRIELIHRTLTSLYQGTGITTQTLSEQLNLSRANVSSDLNELCRQERCYKEGKKPVFYHPRHDNRSLQLSPLDGFCLQNPSLASAITQAKAAVHYPPHGMHMMILGETGTGKSMFAKLIHEHACHEKVLSGQAPFIHFNCADYANNVNLLLGQLFGVKRGAYSGAEENRAGLLERAHGGILFLDEIHRLPPEGQEMFFTFIDTGSYRRLGESEQERHADIVIIAATTEDIDSVLLGTFRRRIPMTMTLPALHQRTLKERFDLVSHFIQEESSRLKQPLTLSSNSLRAFLNYPCSGNIGQLKNDLQITCAKAYLDSLSKHKQRIYISSRDLAEHIKQGLYQSTHSRDLWHLLDIKQNSLIFSEQAVPVAPAENRDSPDNIYDLIEQKLQLLKQQQQDEQRIEQIINQDIHNYFRSFIDKLAQEPPTEDLARTVSPESLPVIEKVIALINSKLATPLNAQVTYALAQHIDNTLFRIVSGYKIVSPNLNSIRVKYKTAFNIALSCLAVMERALNIVVPLDEATFITMFLVHEELEHQHNKSERVTIMVLAHGNSTASSMAEVANTLLCTEHAIAIDARLNEAPEQVLARIKEIIATKNLNKEILFLADMGSLANFGHELEQSLCVRSKT